MSRLQPIYRYGWAFLLALVFSVFYTQAVEGYTGSVVEIVKNPGLVVQLVFLCLPVLFSVLTLLLIVALEKRVGSPIDHPNLFWIAPLAVAIACPLLFIQSGTFELTVILFTAGAALSGFGTGCMWVMWGEYYAKVSQEDVEHLAPASAAIAAVLVLLVSAMSGWVAVAVVMCFAPISGFCLSRSWRDVQRQAVSSEYLGESERQAYETSYALAASRPWTALRSMWLVGLVILVACLFVCLLGSFWDPLTYTMPLFQATIVISIVAMIVVSIVSMRGPRRISVSFLFRWICPVLIVGFVTVILWGTSFGGYAAFIVSIAARFSFCLITQMFFANYARSGRTTAVQAYGFGWVFVHLGDFLGMLGIVILNVFLASGQVAPYEISAVAIAVLAVLTLPRLGKYETEADAGREQAPDGWKAADESTEAAEPKARKADELEGRVRAIAKKHQLTPREIEVFELLARGRSVPFIRDTLVISRDTAATHVKHIYKKLGVHSRQELIDLTQKRLHDDASPMQ